MELVVNLIVGIVAGIGSGALATWINRPSAVAAAEETRARTAQRRKLIGEGRDLLAQAAASGWHTDRVAADVRFFALRRHLSPEIVREGNYDTPAVQEDDLTATAWVHDGLADEIDRLEREWNLA